MRPDASSTGNYLRSEASSTGNSWVFPTGNGHNGNGNGSLQQSPNFLPTPNFHFPGNDSNGSGYGNGYGTSPLQLSPYFSPTPPLLAPPSPLGDSPVYTPHKWNYNRNNTTPYPNVGAREHRSSNPEINLRKIFHLWIPGPSYIPNTPPIFSMSLGISSKSFLNRAAQKLRNNVMG